MYRGIITTCMFIKQQSQRTVTALNQQILLIKRSMGIKTIPMQAMLHAYQATEPKDSDSIKLTDIVDYRKHGY